MSTYIFGKLDRSRFITPGMIYTHNIQFPALLRYKKCVPCLLDDSNNICVFYNAPVFNSYLLAIEEGIYKLYSSDNKITIIKTEIEFNTLYTFRIVEETQNIRVCELFCNNVTWVGKTSSGKLNMNNKKCEVITNIGSGQCILQNNTHKKEIEVLLWKVKNNKMYFVEINNQVKGPIDVTVESKHEKYLIVSNGNVRGILHKTVEEKKIYRVLPKRFDFAFYFFEEVVKLEIDNEIEAEILYYEIVGVCSENDNCKRVKNTIQEDTNKKSVDKNSVNVTYTDKQDECKLREQKDETNTDKQGECRLRYQIYSGFIKLTNVRPEFVEKIKSKKFHFLRGKIVNIKNDIFELSQVEKISVPFEIENACESEEIETQNSVDSKLVDILNLIKTLAECDKYQEVVDVYYKHIHLLNTLERDDLSLVYCNFLQYVNKNPNKLIKEINKVKKHCSDNFLEKVGTVSEIFEVVEFCYQNTHSRELYKKYIEMCYKLDKEVNDYRFVDIAIDLVYKYDEMPRLKAEKIVGNDKMGWMRYIDNEKDNYKRMLYRRVVNMKWKVCDMKEWFKKWMQYEKEHNGNVDEVMTLAKEFVENIKKA